MDGVLLSMRLEGTGNAAQAGRLTGFASGWAVRLLRGRALLPCPLPGASSSGARQMLGAAWRRGAHTGMPARSSNNSLLFPSLIICGVASDTWPVVTRIHMKATLCPGLSLLHLHVEMCGDQIPWAYIPAGDMHAGM